MFCEICLSIWLFFLFVCWIFFLKLKNFSIKKTEFFKIWLSDSCGIQSSFLEFYSQFIFPLSTLSFSLVSLFSWNNFRLYLFQANDNDNETKNKTKKLIIRFWRHHHHYHNVSCLFRKNWPKFSMYNDDNLRSNWWNKKRRNITNFNEKRKKRGKTKCWIDFINR